MNKYRVRQSPKVEALSVHLRTVTTPTVRNSADPASANLRTQRTQKGMPTVRNSADLTEVGKEVRTELSDALSARTAPIPIRYSIGSAGLPITAPTFESEEAREDEIRSPDQEGRGPGRDHPRR